MPVNSKKKRGIVIALLVAAAGVILALALRPEKISVHTASVSRGTLSVTVQEQGRTRARDRYTVAAPITGRLLRSRLKEGDRLEQGETVAKMAPPPEDSRAEAVLQAAVVAAAARKAEMQARLEEIQSSYDRAQSEFARRQELYQKGLIGIEDRDLYAQTAEAARARLASAKASLAAARAELDSARARLLGASSGAGSEVLIAVTTPVRGTVLRIYEESERVVQAGSPLVELNAGDRLELVIDLLTTDAVKVQAGAPILITGWGGDSVLKGVVRYVEPGAFTKISTLGVEEQRVNVIGDLIDAAPNLGAGYRIEAAIVTWSADDVLRIPTSAIFRRQNGWHTFVIEDGRARLRALKLGRRGTDFAQVLEGVSEGDQVLEFPSDLIADGVHVEPVT
jgi:HlyD family secretion protein